MKKKKRMKKMKVKKRKMKRIIKKKRKKKMSIREHVVDILKRSGKSLHYRDITKRIKKRGYRFHRKDPERSVYIIINRYPKLFRKVRPATYRTRK